MTAPAGGDLPGEAPARHRPGTPSAPAGQATEPLPVDVISIQSQVVYGSVGNSVAVPTLQADGLNVVAVPTVLLSNTPHYDSLHGGAVPLEWFEGFLADLRRREASRSARAVLIGYLGSPGQAEALATWLEHVTAERPELMVVLDPVMGDHDSGVYVNPQLPPVLRERLLPLATGLTPNSFEFERLVGTDVSSVETTVQAARSLLGGRTKWVVVTSAAPGLDSTQESRIVVVTPERHEVVSWRPLESAAKGTGDLFSAALTSNLLRRMSLERAVESAHSRVAAVLARTAALNCKELVISTPDPA